MIEPCELSRLLSLYDLEGYLFGTVSESFRRDGTLSSADFFAIVIWKSNRSKTGVKRGLESEHTTPRCLMCRVAKAEPPEDKVRILTAIPGIGLALASAILTVCYPDEYTVLDYRAWETLATLGAEGLPPSYPYHAEGYLAYCFACRSLARASGISLRDLDRALWAKSWEEDLILFVKDIGDADKP